MKSRIIYDIIWNQVQARQLRQNSRFLDDSVRSRWRDATVDVSQSVSPNCWVTAIKPKATKRLWFLKNEARWSFWRWFAVFLPILEYACQAWHTSLTKEQSKSLEDAPSSSNHRRQRVVRSIVTCLTCLHWLNAVLACVAHCSDK